MVEALEEVPQVAAAARVARVFRQDPVAMLDDGGDPFLLWVRIAAANIVGRDEEKQANEAKAKGRSKRR